MDNQTPDNQPNKPIQIREGAGREESMINVEFVDWLKKYSTPILLVLCVVVLGYVGLQRYRASQLAKLDEAFFQLDKASESGSPEALLAVARDHPGRGNVEHIATIGAARLYLAAARTGMVVGAVLNPDGTPIQPEDVLTPEARAEYLEKATSAFSRVIAGTKSDPNLALTTLEAMIGLASVAETKGDQAAAKSVYEDIDRVAQTSGFPGFSLLAKQRLETLPSIANPPTLLTKAQLPAVAPPASPFGPVIPPPVMESTSDTDVGSQPAGPQVPPTSATPPSPPGPTTTTPSATPAPTPPTPTNPTSSTPPKP
jgi:hypothetical protein